MSMQQVAICDIDKCEEKAIQQIRDFLYIKWTDQGQELVLMDDVDLCSKHYWAYMQKIPVVHIEGSNAHRNHEGDIR